MDLNIFVIFKKRVSSIKQGGGTEVYPEKKVLARVCRDNVDMSWTSLSASLRVENCGPMIRRAMFP